MSCANAGTATGARHGNRSRNMLMRDTKRVDDTREICHSDVSVELTARASARSRPAAARGGARRALSAEA
eukprot:1703184-Prymnesium_polylepis.1